MGLRKLKEKLGFRGSAKADAGGSAVQQASAVSSDEASKPSDPEPSHDEPGPPPALPNSDPPIHELWNIAYEKLREDDDALVLDYEKKLCGDLSAGLGALVGASAISRREQMAGILQRKMDEINRETWKLRFGNAGEVAVKDLAEPVLGVISRANEYIAGALASNPYASMAWTGIALLLPLLLNPSEQAAALAKGLDHISSLVSQSRMWEELYVRRYESQTTVESGEQAPPASLSHSEYKNALEMLYVQILKFQATSYCYLASKSAFRLGLDVVKWNDWDTLLDDIRERERVFTAISAIWRDMKYDEECAAAEARQRETMLRWDAIGADVTGLRRAVEDAQRESKRTKLLGWLCDIDPSEMYNTARDRHEEGTGDWLIRDDEKFQLWEDQPSSLLWLHGKAGCGKSILSSTVIKHLRERHSSDPRTALAYFYFTFSDTKKQSAIGLLESLVKQLCSRRPILPQQMETLYEYKERGERPDAKTLEATLIASMAGFSTVHVVIDALDECPALSGERRKLLHTIRRIATAAPANLHMLCTSRRELDIHGVLSPLLSAAPWGDAIDLTAVQYMVDHDIGLYIDSIFASDDFESWPDHVKSEARKLLIERADGMFQYVAQQFDALRDLSSEALIRKALHELPVGLDATYDRVLQNIDPKFQSQVASSLKWLALSHQPLRPRELAEIFIIRPERAIAFDTAERLFNAEDVLKYLSSLVLAEKVWREDMEDRRDREGHLETCIRLAHFSIKEYLTSDRITEGPAARFAFSEADAHLHIALSCIAYHMQRSAADYSDHDGVQGFWLSAYAAHYWMAHMETVPRESWPQEVASAAAGALAVGSRSLSYILRKFDFRISNSESSVNPITDVMLRLPHCLTASLGYVQLTDMLISSHEYLTQEDLDAALVRAAHQGCTAVMELLLKKGADINAQDGEFGSPLQAAIRGLQPAAVEFLVGRGANVHHPPNHLGSVLTPTMDRDERWIHGRREARLKCLRTLLDSGADVNMSGGSARDDETPLHTAAQSVKDNLEQFHLLIERGANVNARGGKYGYPLQALCATDSPSKLVELLLDKGADINAVGGMYGTALQTSCNAGNIGVMELLLDRGADPNARGGCYETALQAACQGSWHFILDRAQLLVDRGADIHAQGGQYGNALQASCYGGNIDVVEWLLDLGADVNAPGGEYGSALQAGCSNGNIERVEIGLDLGADPNARGGRHTRPLKDALINFSSDFDLANLLVKWGADINAQGGEHGTALQASVYRGNFEMVEWLLDLGADVNASGSEYGSALQAAAAARFFLGDRGDDKRRMMQLLLSRGADVNQRGGKYGTALHAAVECQNADSVRLLLDHGADINAEDGEYGTALQTACARYDGEDIALFLLERGADVHIQGGRFGSAWHAVAKQWGDKWEEVMQLLLDRGVDINDARGRQHATALEAALTTAEWDKSLCPDKVRFLLDRGADVNVQAGQYGFPLQAACCRVVRLKAGHGNSVHIDYDNTTESVHAVQLLLDNCPGIDVNAQGGKFGTALQAAAYFGQASSVELLLREGADANLSGGKYGNALNAAVVSGWWNVVDVLLAAGATPDCWLRAEPDEEWFARVGEEEARAAVERYRVFWRKQKEKKGQASG